MSKTNISVVKKIAGEIISHAFSQSRKDKVHPKFHNWYAGITNNPAIRAVGHKRKLGITELKGFKTWHANTFANARAIEEHLCDSNAFSHCRLKGGSKDDNAPNPSKWVYVYHLPVEHRKS